MREILESEIPELVARGEPFGLTVEQVVAADALTMSVSTYKALLNVATIDDYRRLEHEEQMREQARAEIEYDRVKAGLGGGS